MVYIKKLFWFLLIVLIIMSCKTTKSVPKVSAPVIEDNVDYKALLSGTFKSGIIPGSGKMATLILDASSKNFNYFEQGGIKNESYTGTYSILGNNLVLTGPKNIVSRHEVRKTNTGFQLTCKQNLQPVTFNLKPIMGMHLEYYKQ